MSHLDITSSLYILNTRTYYWEKVTQSNWDQPIYFYSNNRPVKYGLKDYKINERIVGDGKY